MKYKGITIFILIITAVSFWASRMLYAEAREPQRPDVNRVFDAEKEVKINEIRGLPVQEAFRSLKGAEFLSNEDLLNKGVFQSFRHRKKEAIALALNNVRAPLVEVVDGEFINRSNDFYVAKKVLQVFPDEAILQLKKLYRAGDATTKGNIIRVIGSMEGGPDIKDLLFNALEDKAVSGEENPEVDGDPLRICDEAYNQLVLRYQVKNVLRTIGPGHRIEVRDYHINVLKGRLKDLF